MFFTQEKPSVEERRRCLTNSGDSSEFGESDRWGILHLYEAVTGKGRRATRKGKRQKQRPATREQTPLPKAGGAERRGAGKGRQVSPR